MTSPYAHLVKLYQMLIVENFNKEMEKKRVHPPSRVVISWLGGESVCIVCGADNGLIGINDFIQCSEDGKMEDITSIIDLIYTIFYIEIVDEYKCAELCSGCLSRLRDADAFRKQVTAVNINTFQNTENQENTEKVEVVKKKTKRNIFSTLPKKDPSSLPPKLAKDAKACPVCGAEAVDYYHLRAHYMRHFLNLICEKCGRGFNQQKSLNIHMMQHTEKKITCQFCLKDYATKLALNQHIKCVHKKIKMYPCKHCGQRFSSSTTRMKHMWEDHGVPCRTYSCGDCNQVFYTVQRRDLHIKRKHLQLKDHECEWCDYACVSATELVVHKQKHSGERNFSCDQCNKSFKTQRSVREHVKTHLTRTSELLHDDQSLIAQPSFMETGNFDETHIDNLETITFITL